MRARVRPSPPNNLSPPSSDGEDEEGEDGDGEEDNLTILDRLRSLKADLLAGAPIRPPGPVSIPSPSGAVVDGLPPRVRRKREYAALQKLWKKNRTRAAKNILAGKSPIVTPALPEGTKEFWVSLFQRESPLVEMGAVQEGLTSILEPVTEAELDWMLKASPSGTAPGPDGVTTEILRGLDRGACSATIIPPWGMRPPILRPSRGGRFSSPRWIPQRAPGTSGPLR